MTPPIHRHLTFTFVDSLGDRGPLYHPDDVQRALHGPRPVKALADELVADLLVSAGRHPAAVRHLAETSGQPAKVVNLVEERPAAPRCSAASSSAVRRCKS